MQLYLYNINDKIEFCVMPKRNVRAQKYRNNDDKKRCLVGGMLMQRYAGIDFEHTLCYGINGKPLSVKGDIHFNLSHSGDYVALITAKSEVGVDIEKVMPYSMKVAEKCFTKSEIEWLMIQKNQEAFYKLWTAKESIMKATGLGFLLEPSSFCVLPVTNGDYNINDKTWHLRWIEISGHICCTASEKEELQIIKVNF